MTVIRQRVQSFLRIAPLVLVLCGASGCQEPPRSDMIAPKPPVPHDLYCLLGSLAIKECFDNQDVVLVVRKPLELGDDLVDNLVREFSVSQGKPTSEIKEKITEAAASSFTWGTGCGFRNVIEDVEQGTDVTGIFPRTDQPSYRILISTPILINENVAVVVANCTDCQRYFSSHVIILEDFGGWRVRTSYIYGFA